MGVAEILQCISYYKAHINVCSLKLSDLVQVWRRGTAKLAY